MAWNRTTFMEGIESAVYQRLQNPDAVLHGQSVRLSSCCHARVSVAGSDYYAGILSCERCGRVLDPSEVA